MELGAGIGRFTRPLAERAASVVALDFMPNLIEQNEKDNAHLGNIDFRCVDGGSVIVACGLIGRVIAHCCLGVANWGRFVLC